MLLALFGVRIFYFHRLFGKFDAPLLDIMGGIGAVAEPLVVITLLFGGTWINRNLNPGLRRRPVDVRRISEDDVEGARGWRHRETDALLEEDMDSRSSSPSLLPDQEPNYRLRAIGIWGWNRQVTTPNTRKFKGYFLSRLLERFPFLVECWYWALIYWVWHIRLLAIQN